MAHRARSKHLLTDVDVFHQTMQREREQQQRRRLQQQQQHIGFQLTQRTTQPTQEQPTHDISYDPFVSAMQIVRRIFKIKISKNINKYTSATHSVQFLSPTPFSSLPGNDGR